ncbi:hypothetical protein MKX03_017407 [Papaver bracteatum]|nr:hypothetical protein MKX03_017407 [Papaver bracteatum]
MDGAAQTVYPSKNWSSMVLYNCGAFLHRFAWPEDSEIGSLPFIWNFLVGHNKVDENDPYTQPKAIHYTSGGPWFQMWKNCEFADLWLSEMEAYNKEITNQV